MGRQQNKNREQLSRFMKYRRTFVLRRGKNSPRLVRGVAGSLEPFRGVETFLMMFM